MVYELNALNNTLILYLLLKCVAGIKMLIKPQPRSAELDWGHTLYIESFYFNWISIIIWSRVLNCLVCFYKLPRSQRVSPIFILLRFKTASVIVNTVYYETYLVRTWHSDCTLRTKDKKSDGIILLYAHFQFNYKNTFSCKQFYCVYLFLYFFVNCWRCLNIR